VVLVSVVVLVSKKDACGVVEVCKETSKQASP